MNYENYKINATKILEFNQKKLYKIPQKYKYLSLFCNNLGENTSYNFIERIYRYVLDRELIFVYEGKYCFYLTTNQLKGLNKTNSNRSTSGRINYIFACGLFKKVYQKQSEEIDFCKLSNINFDFLSKKKNRTLPINHFCVQKYTAKKLEEINRRMQILHDHGITEKNISRNKLIAVGLEEIAHEVYFNNTPSFDKKQASFSYLENRMKEMIKEKGYCTKDDLYKILNKTEIDTLLQIFSSDIKEIFTYKKPTKKECLELELKDLKYIYREREG